MLNTGPIVLAEEDSDNQKIIAEVPKSIEVTNQVAVFKNGMDALQYLQTTSDKPPLILCDINMPIIDGLELRANLEADAALKSKNIPFIVLSTTNNPSAIR